MSGYNVHISVAGSETAGLTYQEKNVYYSRIADTELTDRLESAGVVVIEGPKACGKTATARQVANSEVLLDVDENARRAIAVDPALVLCRRNTQAD